MEANIAQLLYSWLLACSIEFNSRSELLELHNVASECTRFV
jgi:hypothetical protein